MRQHFGKRLTAFGEANVIAAMVSFADAEAAAMRERAAKAAWEYGCEAYGMSAEVSAAENIEVRIRDLPTTD